MSSPSDADVVMPQAVYSLNTANAAPLILGFLRESGVKSSARAYPMQSADTSTWDIYEGEFLFEVQANRWRSPQEKNPYAHSCLNMVSGDGKNKPALRASLRLLGLAANTCNWNRDDPGASAASPAVFAGLFPCLHTGKNPIKAGDIVVATFPDVNSRQMTGGEKNMERKVLATESLSKDTKLDEVFIVGVAQSPGMPGGRFALCLVPEMAHKSRQISTAAQWAKEFKSVAPLTTTTAA